MAWGGEIEHEHGKEMREIGPPALRLAHRPCVTVVPCQRRYYGALRKLW